MVMYEVNLAVDRAIAQEYEAWLHHHIEEMLGFEGFQKAELLKDEDSTGGVIRWVVHYRVQDRRTLQGYFLGPAERMRADGIRRFGERFTASRRILESEQSWLTT